jgi:hypothetical protein
MDQNPERKGGAGLYANSGEASKKVSTVFEYWSTKLTETSLQMCYALIGANWLAFGSVNGILVNIWAKLSIMLVVLALSSNIVGAWLLSESVRRRMEYAEADIPRWEREFSETASKADPWPFTERIESIGKWMRWIKASFALAAGILFLIGVISKSTSAA